jgi:hypothetical protein
LGVLHSGGDINVSESEDDPGSSNKRMSLKEMAKYINKGMDIWESNGLEELLLELKDELNRKKLFIEEDCDAGI